MKKFFKIVTFSFLIIVLGACCNKKIKEIQILAVNDMHANIDDFPRLAFVVDSLRAIYPDMLLFSAGDNRTGNPYNDTYPGQNNLPMTTMMNRLGFNVGCIGNHEFDDAAKGLIYFTNAADFPIICANADFSRFDSINIKPYVIVENQGVKIAVLGLLETDYNGIPSIKPINAEGINFRNALEVAPEYSFLSNESDVFIALTHIGYRYDTILAKEMPNIDLIIGGHSHDFVEPQLFNGVLYGQAQSKLRFANLFKIKIQNGKVIDKEGVAIDLKKSGISSEYKKMVAEFNNNDYFKAVIGTNVKAMTNKRSIGFFMAESEREIAGADVSFKNQGSVRIDSFPAGDINIGDVYVLEPFHNEMAVCTMNADQVRKFIEISSKMDGGPTHTAGVTYRIRYNSNGELLSVDNVVFDKKIAKQKTFTVALNAFMSSTMNPECLDTLKFIGKNDSDLLMEYISKHKIIDFAGKSSYEMIVE